MKYRKSFKSFAKLQLFDLKQLREDSDEIQLLLSLAPEDCVKINRRAKALKMTSPEFISWVLWRATLTPSPVIKKKGFPSRRFQNLGHS